jgi:hypothetical protein
VVTLCVCWQIVRTDGAVYAFTSHDADLTISGVTYVSVAGFTSTAISTGSTGEVDNVEAHGFLSSAGLDVQDLRNGLFDYATVYLFACNWADLTQGILRLRRGWLGEVSRRSDGSFAAELRGLTQGLTQEFTNVYTPYCRADLGDDKCKVPLLTDYRRTGAVATPIDRHSFVSEPLSLIGGVMGATAVISIRNNVTAGTFLEIDDGISAPLTAGWNFDTAGSTVFSDIVGLITGGATGISVTSTSGLNIYLSNSSGHQGNITKTGDAALPAALDIENFASGYLDNGTLTWITGQNAGTSHEIKTYAGSGSIVVLWLGLNYPTQAGDTFYYMPGCDKRRDTCVTKFNNILNFRGEPDIPGLDAALAYPDS